MLGAGDLTTIWLCSACVTIFPERAFSLKHLQAVHVRRARKAAHIQQLTAYTALAWRQ
jgi:hypothetical protein